MQNMWVPPKKQVKPPYPTWLCHAGLNPGPTRPSVRCGCVFSSPAWKQSHTFGSSPPSSQSPPLLSRVPLHCSFSPSCTTGCFSYLSAAAAHLATAVLESRRKGPSTAARHFCHPPLDLAGKETPGASSSFLLCRLALPFLPVYS